MTRAEILAEIGQRTNKNSTLDANTKARLLNYVNGRHTKLLAMPGAQHLRNQPMTFSSVANQYQYAFANIAKVNWITDTTHRRPLDGFTVDQWRLLQPDPTTVTGTPRAWAWHGYQPVAKQPTGGSELFVVSTAAGDTTQTAYVDVLVTNNYPRTLSKTLTGPTPVSFDTGITDVRMVTKFYLSATTIGRVVLREDTGVGTDLAEIGVGQTNQRYYAIILWPTPADVYTYAMSVTLQTVDLAQDTDVPRLPEDFHRLLVFGPLMDEYQKLDDQRYLVAKAEYDELLGAFKYWIHSTASEPASPWMAWPGTPTMPGGWFPPLR